MQQPTYFLVASSDWNAALSSLGWAFFVCIALVWLAGVDWWQVEWRWRIHRRRRRLRAIRDRRLGRASVSGGAL